MNINILINRKQKEQSTSKAKWLMMKSEYLEEFRLANADGNNIAIRNSVMLIRKCEYQIELCDEWLGFLNKIKKQIGTIKVRKR